MTGWFPHNPNLGQEQQTDVPDVHTLRAWIRHVSLSAAEGAAADTDGVLAAVTDDGSEQVITAGLSNPPYPRNVTATAGGTAGDIGAIQVTVVGTNYRDEAITETLPAFTVDTSGTVVGAKAFKTVTSVTIPAHDGTGATTAIGFGDVYGLPDYLSHDTVLIALVDDTRESTLPTVTVHASNIENNTVDFDTDPSGDTADVYYVV